MALQIRGELKWRLFAFENMLIKKNAESTLNGNFLGLFTAVQMIQDHNNLLRNMSRARQSDYLAHRNAAEARQKPPWLCEA